MEIKLSADGGERRWGAPAKILVSKLRALGDSVLMTATLGELRRLWPESEIHVLVPEGFKDLFKDHPYVDRIWVLPRTRSWLGRWAADLNLIKDFRTESFDFFLGLHAGPRAAFLARWAGAKKKILHNHNFSEKDFCSDIPIPGRKNLSPFIERDLKVLRALGLEVNNRASTFLFVSDEEKKIIEDKLPQGPRLGVGLGASRPTKIWPTENFAEVAFGWKKKFPNGKIFVFASKAEISLLHAFRKSYFDLGGAVEDIEIHSDLSLRQLLVYISLMDIFLGNDSGPRHVAAAFDVPTFTLYGPQDPFECHPYDEAKHPYYFVEGLDCRTNADPSGKHKWCGIQVCIEKKHECMRRIPPALVLGDLINRTNERTR